MKSGSGSDIVKPTRLTRSGSGTRWSTPDWLHLILADGPLPILYPAVRSWHVDHAIVSTEAARGHYASRRRGGLAARRACAAGSDAGDRVPQQRVGPVVRARGGRVPPGPAGTWLCRGRKHRDRIPLGGGSIRAAAAAGGRTGSPTGRRGCDD